MGSEEEKKNDEVVEQESPILNQLSIITDNLETYQGRDTCITAMHWTALVIADLCTFLGYDSMGEKFVKMFLTLSACRVMLRLFDDSNAIREYYRFTKEQSKQRTVSIGMYWLTTVNLLFWVAYNPCEHIAWVGELTIIDADDVEWYYYTNICWAGGLFTSVLLNLKVVLQFYLQQSNKAAREDDPNYSSSDIISHSDMKKSSVIAARDFFDWVVAISFMPQGWLFGLLPWASNLHYYQVGLIGLAGSYCRSLHYVVNRQ